MGKKKKAEKTESQIFLEKLTVIVAERLKKEKWCFEDAQMKKLTKKEKQNIQKKRAEELKVAVEHERLRLLEEERLRLEVERQLAIEKEFRDSVEHQLRMEQLEVSCHFIRRLQQQLLRKERKDNQLLEWEQYLKCDGLPDPQNCGEMNTFLHLWDKIKDTTLSDLATQKTNEVLRLLSTLDDFLECPAVPKSKKVEWLIIRNKFRDYQRFNLDCLAYRLFRDIDTHLDRESIPIARKLVQHPKKTFVLIVWALVQLPVPMPNPKRAPRPPFILKFPEVGILEAAMPPSVDMWEKCVRAMYTEYDHFSHKCSTYLEPPVPPGLKNTLDKVTFEEWIEKTHIVEETRERVKAERELKIKELLEKAQASSKLEDREAFKKADAAKNEYIIVDGSAIYLIKEDEQYEDFHQQLHQEVPEKILNLRETRILGGIYTLELWEQPPQPTTMVLQHVTLCSLPRPKLPRAVPFLYECRKPPESEPGDTRSPEDIEADLKFLEQEYENLIIITMQLSSTVIWLDQPVVCQWDDELLTWSTHHIYDVKHNEEQQTVQFKAGRFGIFSLAIKKYISMPYQAWDLKPASGQKVILTIMCPILILEFTIQGSEISLTQLQNVPTKALDYLVGKWFTVPKLKRLLRRGGIDIFPMIDAFEYVEGTCEKQWALEQHVYYQMAQCSMYFNFAWSRWNCTAGRRNIVMQLRESSAQERVKHEQANYQMLMLTPLRALIVDCSEVSQTFNDEGIKKMKFYPDLHHLILGISAISMKCKLEKTPPELINTVAQLLIATRILSLS